MSDSNQKERKEVPPSLGTTTVQAQMQNPAGPQTAISVQEVYQPPGFTPKETATVKSKRLGPEPPAQEVYNPPGFTPKEPVDPNALKPEPSVPMLGSTQPTLGKPPEEKPTLGSKPEVPESNLSDEEILAKVEKILDSTVRPGIAQDGGNVQVHSYKDGILQIYYEGHCVGCSMSTMGTLQFIKKALMSNLSEIKDVVPA